MITLDDIVAARERITPYVRRTETVRSETLSRRLGTNVYLKLELFQKTGSFKPRAAFNLLLRLTPEERARGAVGVSGGNFAQGLAYAGAMLNVPTRILMPEYTPRNYVEATRGYGAEIELVPDISTAFTRADEYRAQGWNYCHPFDDPDIMAGDGTIGLELLSDVPDLTDVFVSVGGGGLMTGIAVAVKSLKPKARVWSVETEGAHCLALALAAGNPVTMKPASLARTLGSPYAAADALQAARELVEQHTVVSDRDAYVAQRFILERAKVLPELAASCTLAAAGRARDRFSPGDHVVLVLCGGNVSLDDLADYRARFEPDSVA